MKSTDSHDPKEIGPLAGIRVLELGSFIAGPFAGQILGDLGAEVIKIEPPDRGDPMRSWGICIEERSLWWPTIARNKKSVVIDLRQPEGRELVVTLAARCDVLLENFRPGRLDEWGLSYERLSSVNPQIVMARVSGFGQTGPRAGEAGFGSIGEAMGGIRHITGFPDRPPTRTGISLGDSLGALFAVIGTLAALQERERTGQGQEVDVAIYEAVLALMESSLADYDLADVNRERSGTVLPGVAPSNVYQTADDRQLLIAANANAVFTRLCEAMNQSDLAKDPRFSSHQARGKNMVQVDEYINTWTNSLPYQDLVERLQRHAVPHGPIHTAADILVDEHIASRSMILRIAAGFARPIPMTAPVPRFSRTNRTTLSPGPELGEHTDEVLREITDLDDRALGKLRATGVVG